MAREGERARRTRERIARVKRLLDASPSITVKEIASRLRLDVQAVYRALRALGVDVQSIGSGFQANADDADMKFAQYAFGNDYENPVGEQDEEYKRECERIGRPGFFYVGELWSIYRDFWEHKRAGLTYSDGVWRKSTAYDGSHAFSHGYGVMTDYTPSARPTIPSKTNADWDDYEDWTSGYVKGNDG